MEANRLTGPESGVLKYDVLTALSVSALNGTQSFQTSVLRLIALVTARYNWRADEVTVGQRDMARMWSVNERTVKREIKRLTENHILICKRPGVRGRVGAYRLNLSRIAELSQPNWHLVGPDFDARMRGRYQPMEAKVIHLDSYVEEQGADVSCEKGTLSGVRERLRVNQGNLFRPWFSKISFDAYENGVLRLTTGSEFVRTYVQTHLMHILHAAVERELGHVDRVEFEVR